MGARMCWIVLESRNKRWWWWGGGCLTAATRQMVRPVWPVRGRPPTTCISLHYTTLHSTRLYAHYKQGEKENKRREERTKQQQKKRGVICAESLSLSLGLYNSSTHPTHTSLIQPLIPFYTHTHTHGAQCTLAYVQLFTTLPPSSSWMIIKSIGVCLPPFPPQFSSVQFSSSFFFSLSLFILIIF